MRRSKLPYFFLALAAILAASAVFLLIRGKNANPQTPPASQSSNTTPAPPPRIDSLRERPAPEDPDKVLADLGVGVATADPAVLINQIAQALEAGDLAKVGRLIGKDALDPETLARLKAFSAVPLKIRQPDGIREVGEIELNARSRWAIHLDGQPEGRDRIFLDLRRVNGKWMVEKLTLPPASDQVIPKTALPDALGAADAFTQAVLSQQFEVARTFVDPATVSDTKIAGLCILFEEGGYQLRKSKPLRSLFQREDTAGFLANLDAIDPAAASQTAQFALNLKRPAQATNWIVSEINLDQLLADYARRVAGGDIYYSPLVKNPAGGDTLALYFEFDHDEMNPRTRRQLEIVTKILKSDPGKKITLSGHTDALGTKDYNNSLSSRRADVVRDFLIQAGVAQAQIVTVAKGDSQPRRPNLTETGTDNPEGRRANRRTEIYLDF